MKIDLDIDRNTNHSVGSNQLFDYRINYCNNYINYCTLESIIVTIISIIVHSNQLLHDQINHLTFDSIIV